MLEDSTNKSLVSIVDINCLLAEDLLEPPTDAHHGNGAAVTGGAVVEEGVHIMETLLIDMYDSAKLHLVKLLLKTDLHCCCCFCFYADMYRVWSGGS